MPKSKKNILLVSISILKVKNRFGVNANKNKTDHKNGNSFLLFFELFTSLILARFFLLNCFQKHFKRVNGFYFINMKRNLKFGFHIHKEPEMSQTVPFGKVFRLRCRADFFFRHIQCFGKQFFKFIFKFHIKNFLKQSAAHR